MSAPEAHEVARDIVMYLEAEVLGSSVGINTATPLLSTGLLTSLNLIKLVGHLEAEYAVVIDPLDYYGPKFANAAALAEHVLALREGQS